MENKIKIKDKKINYILRRNKRTKNLRLTVYCDGDFVVSAPRNITLDTIEQYISDKSEWILEKLKGFGKRNKKNIFSNRSRKKYLEFKHDAMKFAKEKVEKFNKIYNFKYNRISIRNQKTRWGSCSSKGNLNYNYKIYLLEEKYAEYIIVHELCHLKEFNHSRKFWNLVSLSIPDYKERIREMKNF